jgi:hypothetical protein
MKKAKVFLLILSIVLLLVSCKAEIPNPIIGTYSLKAEGSTYDTACICLKKDGTFVFEQIVPGTRETITLKGTYTYTLRAFNFTSADGSISLKETTPISASVSGTFLKEGTNDFLYGWKCDKNEGPQELTLVTNPNDSNAIYEFIYSGSEEAL